MLKRCSRCGILKEVSEFYRHRGHKDGLQSVCKECSNIKVRKYQQTPEGKAVRGRSDKKYSQTPKGKASNRRRGKRYRQTPKGKASDRRCSQRYLQTPNGKALNRRHNQKRRAIENNCEGTISTEEFDRIVKSQDNRCNMCGKRFCKTRPVTVDHIIPLSKGGAHSSSNIQALCGSCNSSKNAKILKCFIVSWPAAMQFCEAK